MVFTCVCHFTSSGVMTGEQSDPATEPVENPLPQQARAHMRHEHASNASTAPPACEHMQGCIAILHSIQRLRCGHLSACITLQCNILIVCTKKCGVSMRWHARAAVTRRRFDLHQLGTARMPAPAGDHAHPQAALALYCPCCIKYRHAPIMLRYLQTSWPLGAAMGLQHSGSSTHDT